MIGCNGRLYYLKGFCNGAENDAKHDESNANNEHGDEFLCNCLWIDVAIPAKLLLELILGIDNQTALVRC